MLAVGSHYDRRSGSDILRGGAIRRASFACAGPVLVSSGLRGFFAWRLSGASPHTGMPVRARWVSGHQARLLAQKLTDLTGKPVVVENRLGAGGMVGAAAVARAKPDGYTLLLVTGAYPAAAALAAKPAFDPLKDMTMVSMVTSYPFILNVPAQSPHANLSDFLAHARRHPGALNYASSGLGSIGHLTV